MRAIWSRIEQIIRSLVPLLSTLLLAMVSVVPTIPFDANYEPLLTLMAVFYWTLYRPDLLPISAIFFVGMLQDMVAGDIVGSTAVLLLGVYAIVVTQRRLLLGKPFMITWWGFLMVALVFGGANWLLLSLLAGQVLPLYPIALRCGVSVALFPLMVWVLIRTHRRALPRIVA